MSLPSEDLLWRTGIFWNVFGFLVISSSARFGQDVDTADPRSSITLWGLTGGECVGLAMVVCLTKRLTCPGADSILMGGVLTGLCWAKVTIPVDIVVDRVNWPLLLAGLPGMTGVLVMDGLADGGLVAAEEDNSGDVLDRFKEYRKGSEVRNRAVESVRDNLFLRGCGGTEDGLDTSTLVVLARPRRAPGRSCIPGGDCIVTISPGSRQLLVTSSERKKKDFLLL